MSRFDIEPFLELRFGGGVPCDNCTGDANGDGVVDAFDITRNTRGVAVEFSTEGRRLIPGLRLKRDADHRPRRRARVGPIGR